jgi:hypothetical protein
MHYLQVNRCKKRQRSMQGMASLNKVYAFNENRFCWEFAGFDQVGYDLQLAIAAPVPAGSCMGNSRIAR